MHRGAWWAAIYGVEQSCKESACNVGDLGMIPGLGRSPVEGNSYPLQYSGLENSMDRGAWQAVVCGVAKTQTQLSDFTFTFHFHALEKEMATHSSVLVGSGEARGSQGGNVTTEGVEVRPVEIGRAHV